MAEHFIPTRHKPQWQAVERHSGVDFCAVAGCGVFTIHAHTYAWRRLLQRAVCRVCGVKK